MSDDYALITIPFMCLHKYNAFQKKIVNKMLELDLSMGFKRIGKN